jgi:hypothetical protein
VLVEQQVSGAISELVAKLRGEALDRAHHERKVQLALAAIRGLAVTQQFESGRASRASGRAHSELS